MSLQVALKEIFSEPENLGIKQIWRRGSADVVVFRTDKPVAIIEPGVEREGSQKKEVAIHVLEMRRSQRATAAAERSAQAARWAAVAAVVSALATILELLGH